MNYQQVYIEGTTDIDPDRVIKLEGETAGAVIHSKLRFWSKYQEWLAEGNTPRPAQPNGYCDWDEATEQWVERTADKEDAEAQTFLVETDKQQARGVDDIIAYIENGTPLPQVLLDRKAAREVARGKLKPKG